MSDADYCDCDRDYDQPEFWCVTHPKARKQHRCDECYGPIFPGEIYKKSAGKFEGDFMQFEECHLCSELRQWAIISMPCFCAYEVGTLHDRVRSMVRDVAPKVPGFIREWGKRMVAIRQRKASVSQTR